MFVGTRCPEITAPAERNRSMVIVDRFLDVKISSTRGPRQATGSVANLRTATQTFRSSGASTLFASVGTNMPLRWSDEQA